MDIPKTGHQYKDRTFLGVVVDNKDPERLERIKVRIRDLFDGVADDELPWVAPKVAKGLGNGGGSRVCAVPYEQSLIYIEFENGDPHFPRYLGSPVTPSTRGDLFDTNYPNRYGYIDPKGNYMYTDMVSGEHKFHHHSGTETIIDDAGNVTLNCVGTVTINITGATVVNAAADVALHVAGTLTSDAPIWNHTGPVMITGDVGVVGKVTSTGDQIAGSVSQINHVHGGVAAGLASTAKPT